MGWLGELESFYKHIEDYHERKLDKSKLVNEFLEFMASNYGYEEEYFRNSFEESGKGYSDSEDYIYETFLGLQGNLRMEYSRLCNKAKERKKEYNQIVHALNHRIEKENEKWTRNKYIFLKEINEKLYNKAIETKNNSSIIRHALSNCSSLNKSLRLNFDWLYDEPFYTLDQYDNIDWKHKINFSYLSISDAQKLLKLKNSNRMEYIHYFEQYINEYNILQHIIEISKQNIYLNNRVPIFKTAIELFNSNNYMPFVYLMVPQVEGLFDVYRDVSEIKVDKNYNGLSDKLEVIYKQKGIWGYMYYAFEFPKLRNDIAHGNIVNIDKECAYDILMDISHLIDEIDTKELKYHVVIDFFIELASKCENEKINYILEYFSQDSLECSMHLEWLQNYITGNYDNIIRWYNVEEAEKYFIQIIGTEQFQIEIFNNEPLTSINIKQINYKGELKEFEVREVNNEVCKYIPLLLTLEKKFTFNQKWRIDVDTRINELDMKREKQYKDIKERFNIDLNDCEDLT